MGSTHTVQDVSPKSIAECHKGRGPHPRQGWIAEPYQPLFAAVLALWIDHRQAVVGLLVSRLLLTLTRRAPGPSFIATLRAMAGQRTGATGVSTVISTATTTR